ncbi:MAG: hypothetical protein IPJ30_23955 [Acidobacteria bacterium]|nr:hypothetical protein [Acidobacteriota bacterium]
MLEPLQAIIPATRAPPRSSGTIPAERRQATVRRLYNSAAVIHDDELLSFTDKTLAPEYDVFPDDPRYFEPNDKPNRPYEINGKEDQRRCL